MAETLSDLSQVVFQGLLGAREGHLRPREAVSREAHYSHRFIQGNRLSTDDPGGEDGYGRCLSFVRVEADDFFHFDLQPRLFEHLALCSGLGPLAALYETAGESPLAVARLDVPLDEHYPPVQLEDRTCNQLRPQVEHEAAPIADQPLRIAAFEHAKSE